MAPPSDGDTGLRDGLPAMLLTRAEIDLRPVAEVQTHVGQGNAVDRRRDDRREGLVIEGQPAHVVKSNLFGLGVVGSYVWRTYENAKGRPYAIVRSDESFGPVA